jgi:3-isopropylmalate dehydrogenase
LNVLQTHQLWLKIVTRNGTEKYPGVPLEHMIVDNCSMQIIRDPKQFDVMLADNMFGDILSDLAGAISGSLEMLPSAPPWPPGCEPREFWRRGRLDH